MGTQDLTPKQENWKGESVVAAILYGGELLYLGNFL